MNLAPTKAWKLLKNVHDITRAKSVYKGFQEPNYDNVVATYMWRDGKLHLVDVPPTDADVILNGTVLITRKEID